MSSPSAPLAFHPIAELFPLMDGEAFEQLVADIRTHGLRQPIGLYEGQVLDGRNRYRACLAAGVEPRFEPWSGPGSPLAFVVSVNLHRRHLSESQRAMVAGKIATLERGRPPENDRIQAFSVRDAADLLNVGHASVTEAKKVHRHGVPELVRAVEEGKASVHAAAAVATLAPEQQRAVVAGGRSRIAFEARRVETRAKPPAPAVSAPPAPSPPARPRGIVTVLLSRDPAQAAGSLFVKFDREYLRELVAELSRLVD